MVPKLSCIVCSRQQIVDIFVVNLNKGHTNGALHLLNPEFVK